MKLYSFLFLVTACSAFAQQADISSKTDKPPLPDPILHRVTDLTPWVFASRSSNETQGDSAKPRTTSIIKSKNVYRIVVSQPDGSALERWSINGMVIKLFPNTDQWSIATSGVGYSQSDFPELGWLTREAYTGVKKIGGADAYCFQSQYSVVDDTGQSQILVQTAAVDVATQWPISFTEGTLTTSYRYGSPVSTPLSIPENIKAILVKQEQFAHPKRK